MSFKFFAYSCFSLILLVGSLACKEIAAKQKSNLPVLLPDNGVVETIMIKVPEINKNIQSTISNWNEFKELFDLITNISQENYQTLESSEEVLTDLFSALITKIPEPINSRSVIARIKVIQTLAYKLKAQYVVNNKSVKFEKTRTELVNSFSNMIFQITKTLEKNSQLISKTE